MKKLHERKLRAGTPEHDSGLCFFILMELTDDQTPQGKRRRSELAEDLSHGTLAHTAVAFSA